MALSLSNARIDKVNSSFISCITTPKPSLIHLCGSVVSLSTGHQYLIGPPMSLVLKNPYLSTDRPFLFVLVRYSGCFTFLTRCMFSIVMCARAGLGQRSFCNAYLDFVFIGFWFSGQLFFFAFVILSNLTYLPSCFLVSDLSIYLRENFLKCYVLIYRNILKVNKYYRHRKFH